VIGDSRSFWNEEAFGALGGVRKLRNFVIEYEATLDRALKQVEAVDRAFEEHQMKCRRMGMREPKELTQGLTPDLLGAKLLHEARVDCIAMEIASLKEWLARAETSEREIMEARCLQYGPWGTGVGEPLREIDFQPVVGDEEGFLRISCARSPYDGMLVADYREFVCGPWVKRISAEMAAALEKVRDVTLPEAERDKWWPVSQQGGKHVPFDQLPPRPEGF
jgi:hypothetical protein